MDIFVTAIGTDSGKTVVSSIITEALAADYWKPVQAGFPKDTDQVMSLVSNPLSEFHQEQFVLNTPASPHYAAEVDQVTIELDAFTRPKTNNRLVIEGAGGMMVPINNQDLVIDIARKITSEVILVSNHYLGSINHTLLSIDYLQKMELPVKGIIFNGMHTASTETIIEKHSPYPILGRIPHLDEVNPGIIHQQAEIVKRWLT